MIGSMPTRFDVRDVNKVLEKAGLKRKTQYMMTAG